MPWFTDPDHDSGEQRTGEAKSQRGLGARTMLLPEHIQGGFGARFFRRVLGICRDGDLATVALA